MMDISAHGNHFDHDNGYQGMNSSCLQQHYPQFQSNSQGAAMGFYPHSLYSQTALEYGITTSNSPVPPDTFYDCSNSYSGTSPQDHAHIISSDNGLSYTNLDYMTAYAQNTYQQQQDAAPQGAAVTSYSPNWMHHHQHHMHHPAYSIDHPPMLNGNATGVQPNAADKCKGYAQGVEVLGGAMSASQQQQQAPNSQTSSAGASNVPTYKWMQVKRNVPKPQSKCENIRICGGVSRRDLLIL